jgi:hypothetical protein
MDDKLEQCSKALSPTLSRREPCSRVTEKSDVQWEKQFRPSILTLAGMQMADKLEQCLKALSPTIVRQEPLSKLTEKREPQSAKYLAVSVNTSMGIQTDRRLILGLSPRGTSGSKSTRKT